jgi:phosphoribosylaminoimidazolecarboxamide formyltransferase / IMP cyclohydrolase
MQLRYGINAQQRSASAELVLAGSLPVELLNGTPSMINLLDALNAWQLKGPFIVRRLETTWV